MIPSASAHPQPALEVGHRQRNQPAPPHVVADALRDPDRDPSRPWLILCPDEQRPVVLPSDRPDVVSWSSLWSRRPDALIRLEVAWDDNHSGTELCWRLFVDPPEPDPSLLGYLRKRLNQLINANLRYSFGQ